MEKFDKPPFSYSCLIAMALRNSENGFLPVSEIYSYIIDKFPYFKTAPDGWKNSIRHNLSLNKCFQKLETPSLNGATRKACLWGLNEAKVSRLNDEISKWIKKGNDSNSGWAMCMFACVCACVREWSPYLRACLYVCVSIFAGVSICAYVYECVVY
ncbi:hypothetical protein HELRODRAFT_87232 [Helobdella robusta]|uniref:Fork-head domain-containing protein n=1 Tax=Helobdella robusta TaxID=6412 RepID=T1G6N2_HELRO|nr:hypothetical protein HELRODRAFT_87232 [Helobdella robusta]ESN95034.1 hypothetical protein HELRODRAFT_87232 [Helobdella robusta]